MQIQSLGQDVALEEEMATHSSILNNSMDRETLWAISVGSQRDTTERRFIHTYKL